MVPANAGPYGDLQPVAERVAALDRRWLERSRQVR